MWLCLEDISRVDRYFHYPLQCLGFPGSSDSEEFACNTGDPSSIPGFGRSPGERNGNPLQYSCLENIMSEEPGRLQFWGSQRVGYDRPISTHINLVFFFPPSLFAFIFNRWLSFMCSWRYQSFSSSTLPWITRWAGVPAGQRMEREQRGPFPQSDLWPSPRWYPDHHQGSPTFPWRNTEVSLWQRLHTSCNLANLSPVLCSRNSEHFVIAYTYHVVSYFSDSA